MTGSRPARRKVVSVARKVLLGRNRPDPPGVAFFPALLNLPLLLAGGVLVVDGCACNGLVLHLICALIKSVGEDNYLKTTHGQTYVDYTARTGRLLRKLFRPKSPLIR
jgi:hypothetical protein